MTVFQRIVNTLREKLLNKGRASRPDATISITPGRASGFRFLLASTVALAIAAACIENGLHPAFILSVPLVMAALLRSNYGKPFLGTEKTLSLMLVPYFVLLLMGVFLVKDQRLTVPNFFVFFAFGILMVRALSPLTDRNISQLLFLTVGLILINCILTNHFLFAMILPFYLFALMGTLMLFNRTRKRSSFKEVAPVLPRQRDRKAWCLGLAGKTAFVVGLTVVLFFILPRPFAAFPGLRTAVSGGGRLADLQKHITYKDMVSMGGRQRIAFLVKLEEGRLPEEAYWRGRVLERTDGRGWYQARQRKGSARPVQADYSSVLKYRTYPIRLHSKYVYVAGLPVWITGTRQQVLFTTDAYEVIIDSALIYSDEYVVMAYDRPIPASPDRDGRNLRADGITERIRQLALSWTEGMTSKKRMADALTNRLRAACRYQLLTPPPPADVHPLEYFLFETKVGNCEYFAGALGLLLRSVGIPARVVEGFYGYEKTAVPNEFLVRFTRAHAWVEANLDDHSWTTLDPTPASRARGLRTTLWGAVSDLFDRMEYRWDKIVVNFDRSDQVFLVRMLARILTGRSPITADITSKAVKVLPVLALVVGLAVLLVLAVKRYRSRQGISTIYARTMTDLVNTGILTKVHAWHEDNVREIVRTAPHTSHAVARFMEMYLRARFGGHQQVTQHEVQRAGEELIRSAKSG